MTNSLDEGGSCLVQVVRGLGAHGNSFFLGTNQQKVAGITVLLLTVEKRMMVLVFLGHLLMKKE